MLNCSDYDLKRADAIRAKKSGTMDMIQLWGQESLPLVSIDIYATPHSDYIVDLEYENDAQLLGLMHRVIEVKGRLPQLVQPRFEELDSLGRARLWGQLNNLTRETK